jgi:succinate dehydrogenase/fumarate reductase flavoprotein subunit
MNKYDVVIVGSGVGSLACKDTIISCGLSAEVFETIPPSATAGCIVGAGDDSDYILETQSIEEGQKTAHQILSDLFDEVED